MPRTLLLAGSYGFRNVGDEAILGALLADLRALRPDLSITVVTGDPVLTARLHGVRSIAWDDLDVVLDAVEASDLTGIGGGGLFHDHWAADPERLLSIQAAGITYTTGLAMLAALAGRPPVLVGVGVGPLVTEAGRELTRLAFRAAAAASVRDPESLDLLAEIGLPPEAVEAVEVTADPVFGLELGAGLPRAPVLGVCLRGWGGDDAWEVVVAEALDRMVERQALRIRFIPFQELDQPLVNDVEVAARVAARMRHGARVDLVREVGTPLQQARLLSGCELVLGMRFHAVVFSAMYGVPAVALSYDPKVRRLMDRLGTGERCLDLEDLTAERLTSQLAATLANRSALAAELAPNSARLRPLARRNAELLVETLERRQSPPATPAPTAPPTAFVPGLALHQTRKLWAMERENRRRREHHAQLVDRLTETCGTGHWLAAAYLRRAKAWARRHPPVYGLLTAGRARLQSLRAPAPPAAKAPLVTPSGSRQVPIVTPLFFDVEGETMCAGGAERYLLELARLLRDLGFEPAVFQCARGTWRRRYADLEVTGLDCAGELPRLNRRFHAAVAPGAFTIYHAFHLATPLCHPRAIGVSHGVYWDDQRFQRDAAVAIRTAEQVWCAIDNLPSVVSVDTATINWVRATRQELGSKLVYIPNFVDTGLYHPPATVPDRLVVLYPRRLYEPRGFWLVEPLVAGLLARHPDVDFAFVGVAEPREELAVNELVRRHPGRVSWRVSAPEAMPEIYRSASITLIPTVHSEGTSLSCLEALASGNAVIGTQVGGIPDLLLPGYNGLLIPPTQAALAAALDTLLRDPALRARLGARGRDVAAAFTLARWREDWTRVLSQLS